MTINLTSFLASLFRLNTAFSGVGLMVQRLAQFPDGRPSNRDREHRGMNG